MLQVDPAAHYGGPWASLHLDELRAALGAAGAAQPPLGDECAGALRGGRVREAPGAALGAPGAFVIDLSPHLLYGAGPAISLLLGSGAHHYTEYKLVQGTFLAEAGGTLLPVPSTRAEVFRDASLAPLQKRALMRFFKGCSEGLEGAGPLAEALAGDGHFADLMAAEGLDPGLRRRLAHGVLLQHAPEGGDLACVAASALFRQYIGSLGRYGPATGPFLTPVYGSGELPQAFCRAAAVGGAVQVLRCGVEGLALDGAARRATGVRVAPPAEADGDQGVQTIAAARVAAGPASLRDWVSRFGLSVAAERTLRAVAVVDGPAAPAPAQALVVAPGAGPGGATVWALQLGAGVAVCPPGQWLLHLWCRAEGGGGEDGAQAERWLAPVLRTLADCGGLEGEDGVDRASEDGDAAAARPRALLAAFFAIDTLEQGDDPPPASWPSNVALCPGPSAAVTLAEAVGQAKRCYWALFPPPEGAHGDPAFPLDEAAPLREEQEGGEDEAGEGAAADADSDDEAVRALKAALGIGAEGGST